MRLDHKPNSVSLLRVMAIHLVPTSQSGSSDLPVLNADNTKLLDLAPSGVYLAAHVTIDTGGLLHHLFTLIPTRESRRSTFCCTCRFHLSGTLPLGGALSCGVRTFLSRQSRKRPFHQPQLFFCPIPVKKNSTTGAG